MKIAKKKAPIYFSNIFISFLGLAYFTPLECWLRFSDPGSQGELDKINVHFFWRRV